jgi:hypothetical protein
MSLAEHPSEEDLVMLYYRENGVGLDRLEAHLANCPHCRVAYEGLTRVLDACNDLPVPEPHPAFESRTWNRLEPQLHPIKPGFRFPLNSRWFAAAGVAAMLLVAFLAGRFTRPHEPARLVAITADGRQRVLLMALGDHLERSQMVLTELANASVPAADLALDRERARNLLSENRLYRQTTADSGDPATAQLLDELERVLLDISHGTDTSEIKARIDAESLLFKLRVLGSNLNRTIASPQPPTKETL